MPKKSDRKSTTLVICIDRDDDLGVKIGVTGPVIGRKDNLAAANRFALKDPADSDVNAIFKALQVFDRLKEKGATEIVTLTGDSDVGMTSDRKISSQLDRVLSKYNVTEAVLVTDGAEDEHVLPMIKSKIGVVYNERIIVKQSQQLESMYYVFYDFILSILADSKASRMFIGLPAIALILYAIFGAAGGRLIVGVIGTYLLVKGFQMEKLVEGIYYEALASLKTRRSSFFMYMSATVPVVIGLMNGYNAVSALASPPIYVSLSVFLQESIMMLFLASVVIGMGKMLGVKKRPISLYLTYFSITFSVAWIIYEITRLVVNGTGTYSRILYALAISGALIFISAAVEKKTKK